ncbi:LolA family protein, partial [Flavobacterium sp.]|uniref:LolA family protein n=1 Tax=Flavobacterium sp. TaxID=239 RepID=UPI002FD9F57D
MKKVVSLILFLALSISMQGQDKKAKDLLDKVTAKIKSYDNIIIDFKYSLTNSKENINKESKGNVILDGNKYYLNFMGITKIYDGKKTYTIVPEDEEITISSLDEKDENAITPSKMLTFFNTGFKYYWDIPQDVKGRKIQYIKLVPNSSKDARKEILLGVDSQTNIIYNVIEIGKNGTKTTLTVNS